MITEKKIKTGQNLRKFISKFEDRNCCENAIQHRYKTRVEPSYGTFLLVHELDEVEVNCPWS